MPAWVEFVEENLLDERTFEQLVLGVSTRGYRRALEPLPETLHPHGTGRRSASRRFVRQAQKQVDA